MAVPRWAAHGVWAMVVVLMTLGLIAAVGRVMFPADMLQREDPVRTEIFRALNRHDPLVLQRAAEVARMDRPFAEHRLLTLLHVVPGGLFFLFAPLQFSSRLRARHRTLHRYSGRILLAVIFTSLVPGLFFGIVMPFGGGAEAVTIALIGVYFLFAMAKAVVAIRRGEIARHREWMIRMFAIALAIATVRLIGAPIDLLLTPLGIPPAELFVLAIWTAWLLTIGGAECWIRYTRRHEGHEAFQVKPFVIFVPSWRGLTAAAYPAMTSGPSDT